MRRQNYTHIYVRVKVFRNKRLNVYVTKIEALTGMNDGELHRGKAKIKRSSRFVQEDDGNNKFMSAL
jgi:hypothetical protein